MTLSVPLVPLGGADTVQVHVAMRQGNRAGRRETQAGWFEGDSWTKSVGGQAQGRLKQD